MADRLDLTVDDGIELRAALRGPRLALGPRILREDRQPIDEETRARWDTWAAHAGGGLIPTPAPRSRRARRRKQQEWQTVHDHLISVTTMHERPVTRAREPQLDDLHLDRDTLRKDLKAEATAGVSAFDVITRSRLRRENHLHLDQAVEGRAAELREQHAQDRDDLQAWWEALRRNDPSTLRHRLHLAFAQHRFSAAVAGVVDDRVDLVVSVAKPAGLVGDREPTTERGGQRTLPKMTKERQHAVYEAAIGSGLLSTASEVFAVAPGVERVATAVLAPEHVGGPAILMLVEMTRDLVLPDGAEAAAISTVAEVEAAEPVAGGRVVVDRGDVSGALRHLDETHPDVAPVLEVVRIEAIA